MRVTTKPIAALARWLAVVGNVVLVVALATRSWQYWPLVIMICVLPWFALLPMAPWRYRTRAAHGVELRLLVFRHTPAAALAVAVGIAIVSVRSGHSWAAAAVLFIAAKLSLTDSFGLWSPRGYDPNDPAWRRGGGIRRVRDRSWFSQPDDPRFELTWSTGFDDRVIEKGFRSCRWVLVRPAGTVLIGGLAMNVAAPTLRLTIALLSVWLIAPALWGCIWLERIRLALDHGRPVSDAQLTQVQFVFERNRDRMAASAVKRLRERRHDEAPPNSTAS